MRRGLALLAALALTACAPQPQEARPAFWQVEGPQGQKAWLLGTIHALERPALWRSPAIDRALTEASTLAVEIANLDDDAAMAHTFAEMARRPGEPPLSLRVAPGLRDELEAALAGSRMSEADFAETETWAAALTLARAGAGGLSAEYGIDRAVIVAFRPRPVVELEGVRGQLALFDRLPESEQRDLLALVLRDAGAASDGETPALAQAWREADMATIGRETRRGILADAELREVLFTQRNRAWAERIAGLAGRGERPFVAVGAAHMAGPDGLPAMLAARGYRVTRVQ